MKDFAAIIFSKNIKLPIRKAWQRGALALEAGSPPIKNLFLGVEAVQGLLAVSCKSGELKEHTCLNEAEFPSQLNRCVSAKCVLISFFS